MVQNQIPETTLMQTTSPDAVTSFVRQRWTKFPDADVDGTDRKMSRFGIGLWAAARRLPQQM
jgi:hypothetical protein